MMSIWITSYDNLHHLVRVVSDRYSFFFFNVCLYYFKFYLFIYLFIFGCVGSSFLCEGIL